MLRRLGLGALIVAGCAAASVAGEKKADAAFFEGGIEGGLAKRSLSDSTYNWSFAWQLHAELAMLPPILMVGPYATFQTTKPDVSGDTGAANSVSFIAIGGRAKLRIPIPGPLTPYGIAGVGYVRANFPDYTLKECVPGGQGAGCVSTQVPNANANFVEFVLGAGLLYNVAGPLALTAEFDWRPTTGYKNDQYQKSLDAAAANQQQTSPPSPSRNGVSYTAMLGLALSL